MTKPGAQPHVKPYVVTDPAAADFLASPHTRYLLGPFLHGETTMSGAAPMLGGLGLNTLHRRVKQMVELGLLEHTRSETRGGHRVKLYRATHQEFVVPLDKTSSVDLESYNDERFKNSVGIAARGVTGEMLRCAPRWGIRVYPSGSGSAFQSMVALDEGGAVTAGLERRNFAGDLGARLSPEDARRLRDELSALYDRLRSLARYDGEGDWYFLTAAFTPT